MRTELETRLKQLPAPDAPTNLKARCLQTIPADVQRAPAKSRGFGRLFSAPKLGLATLVLATAIGLAFWNTRPVADKSAPVSGSVAFAQTVEAMKNVTYARIRGWDIDYRESITAHSTNTKRLMTTTEIDLARGIYEEKGPMLVLQKDQRLAKGSSLYYRAIVLPDGSVYGRNANSEKLYVVTIIGDWANMTRMVNQIFSGVDASSVVVLGYVPDQKPKLVSSNVGTWKGRKANILVFRAAWSEKEQKGEAARNPKSAVEVKLYVAPETKLIMASQGFLLFKDGFRTQINEMEIDYTRPDPALFDPARLKIGAKIVDKRGKK